MQGDQLSNSVWSSEPPGKQGKKADRQAGTLTDQKRARRVTSFVESQPPPTAWLPDGYSQIFRSYVFGPSGFWTMALLRYAAKFDPFLSLDCARVEGVGAQSNERKGSNFAA